MTPIEAAVKAYEYPLMGTSEEHTRTIIAAFLEAAAGHVGVCDAVADAAMDADGHGLSDHGIGRAAILALKETVNG